MRSATEFQPGAGWKPAVQYYPLGSQASCLLPGTILAARYNNAHRHKFIKFKGLSSV
jgi:hypothetical protein